MNKPENRFRTAFAVIAILFTLYGAFYIYSTSFVIDGTRYYSLFDDAMISMRYAKNMVEGHGLVMNPGERVEGVTNPLWVFYMAGLHLLPIAMAKISLLVQLTGLMLYLLTLWGIMKLARVVSKDSFPVTVGALLLTAFYLPLVSWSLQGMEVSLIVFMLTLTALMAVRSIQSGAFSPWVFVLLGLGTWVRIDMAVPFLTVGLFLYYSLPAHRKKIAVWGVSLLAGFMLVQTGLRFAYYGDILPNTYYLKMTGYPLLLRVSRGLIVFSSFILRMGIITFFIPLLALLGKEYTRSRGLLAAMVAALCAYSIYVGGDAWESWGGSNRYISSVMPLYFVLFAAGLDRLARLIVRYFSARRQAERKPGRAFGVVFSVLIVLCGVLLNNNRGPLSLAGFVFKEPPMNRDGNSQMVYFALVAREITTPDASIAVTWAGALPYFSERYTVDILGKTDRYLAHTPMHLPEADDAKYRFFYPGHLKYDYQYSLGQKKPDIVFQLWNDLDVAEPLITANYVQMGVVKWYIYLRKDSPRIHWDLLKQG